MLRDPGCDILQGFAFAKPMSGDDLEHFMAARTPLAAS
jgi:EAL domain-containing protein (putative c-di-GMP-specific phosphodiesterase class I)